MKAKKFKKAVMGGHNDHLTVKELRENFLSWDKETKKRKEKKQGFDVDTWAEETNKIFEDMIDDIRFLTDPNWTPSKVTHFTNRKDK